MKQGVSLHGRYAWEVRTTTQQENTALPVAINCQLVDSKTQQKVSKVWWLVAESTPEFLEAMHACLSLKDALGRRIVKARKLSEALAELAVDPAIDRGTLRKVNQVLQAHSGRVVLAPWAGRAARRELAQSMSAGLSKPDAVRRVVAGLGVSESSARRYLE